MSNNIHKPKVISKFIEFSKKIILPGFDGMPLYDVTTFFFKGIWEGYITSRASSIAFNFFLAIFPSIIFFFTIIPFIPIEHFQDTLLELIKNITPKEAFDTINNTLEDIIKRPRGGLLSLGFILALYFSTNGINSIMEAFNNTYHSIETRSWVKQRLISILLVFIISFIVIIAITLITFGTIALNYLVAQDILKGNFTYNLIQFGKWIVILSICFFTFSFIYYFAPAKKRSFRFISAGSSLATFLSLATSIGFNIYVSDFSRYNSLYGSIGTLLIILLWIYFNSIILLIGFELNASIYNAKIKKLPEIKKS
ncbi:MAG: YihY/virulence factor BrkB family protein [Bacteroidales bacterium]|nr:YihY/virulence factor BrkB family protein [Bacteroidales bacterium]